MNDRPCCRLEGATLKDGWIVQKLLRAPRDARQDDDVSGGTFCAQYQVLNASGETAFLKAFDFSSVFQGDDIVKRINLLTTDYILEKDLLIKCKDRKMSRVVVPLSHGEVTTSMPAPFGTVYYIIFEMAECDIRAKKESGDMMAECIFRSLHGSALGVQQLHRAHIAHHDIKPSNILVFDKDSKVADLGRSFDSNRPSRFDSYPFSGDSGYMPFEKYWGIHHGDFYDRCCSDLFMLGNLLFFHFLDVSVNVLVFKRIEDRGLSVSNVSFDVAKPILIDAFYDVLEDLRAFLKNSTPDISDEVVLVARELCNPDPSQRGYSRRPAKNLRYSVDRYVTKFANLARKARIYNVRRA